MKNLTGNQRQQLYDVGVALIAVAAVYGLLTGEEAAAWALVLAPLLRLARKNVDVS